MLEGRPATTFRLRLPLGPPHTVLLIDDNPDVGDLFHRMLVSTPYKLVHVRTVKRALHLAHEQPPDAIILDIVMPAQDGWEVQEALRQDAKTARVPVIVCSILPDRELAVALGAADFLAKPVTRPTLLSTLDRLLRRAD